MTDNRISDQIQVSQSCPQKRKHTLPTCKHGWDATVTLIVPALRSRLPTHKPCWLTCQTWHADGERCTCQHAVAWFISFFHHIESTSLSPTRHCFPFYFCANWRNLLRNIQVMCYDPPNKGYFVVNTTLFSIISGSRKSLCKLGSWISTVSK